MRRILLDSNVWRYFIDADAVPDLLRAARNSRHRVVVAPSVMYEAARTGDASVRNALLAVLLHPRWKRLMPEAYSEAEEIRSEVRRLKPEWVTPEPDMTWFNRVRYDWIRAKGGNWERIKAHPKLLASLDGDEPDRAREEAYRHRQGSLDWSAKWRSLPLTAITGEPTQRVEGWNGEPVEPWRLAALRAFRLSLQDREHHPYVDWLKGDIELGMMLFQAESLGKFWLHEVAAIKMPRHWLRWAFEFLQRQYAVSDGTPADAQLATYMVEADLLLSADKALVRIAEKCREDAPFSVAASTRVPGGSACVDAVLKQLAAA